VEEVIGVEDWAEIRRLHRAEGMSIKGIERHLGIARNTVRRAVASDDPPKYRRAPRGSIVDAVEPAIRELLAQYPRMPATVIAERIGWERSLSVLKRRVRERLPADDTWSDGMRCSAAAKGVLEGSRRPMCSVVSY
jgi:transposase